MSILPVYRESFFASRQRQDGLRLKMRYRKGVVYCDMSVSTHYEGYEGFVHGGMIFGVLDVMMWYVIMIEAGKVCMTRKTDMDFLKPIVCDTAYRAEARLVRVEERDVWAAGRVLDIRKEICAQTTALFREAKGITYQDIERSLDFTGVSNDVKEMFLGAARNT